jgi:hypothetical protein
MKSHDSKRVKGFMAASERVKAAEGVKDGAIFYCFTRRQLAQLLVEYGNSYSHIGVLGSGEQQRQSGS